MQVQTISYFQILKAYRVRATEISFLLLVLSADRMHNSHTNIDSHTNTDRQTDRHRTQTATQTQTDRQTHKHRQPHKHRQTDRQTDRQTHRQTDRHNKGALGFPVLKFFKLSSGHIKISIYMQTYVNLDKFLYLYSLILVSVNNKFQFESLYPREIECFQQYIFHEVHRILITFTYWHVNFSLRDASLHALVSSSSLLLLLPFSPSSLSFPLFYFIFLPIQIIVLHLTV